MHEQQEQLARLALTFEQEEMADAARLARTALQKVTNEEVWIAVCGHFSAGKSTLLNDWLEEGFLPTSPIPTSANIVTLRGGESAAAVAINDTDWISLDPSSLSNISDYCKVEEIKEVEYTIDRFPFDEHVVLMDTPGIDSTDERHRQATERSLFLADHLFFMMDYNHVQSEQNIGLMKQFSREGRPYSIIINQIDKHDEDELSFVDFKASLAKAFRHHDIVPNDTFYISLRDLKHPHNEVERLRSYVRQVITESRQQQVEHADALIHTLVRRNETSIQSTLDQLPTYEKSPKEMQSRLHRLEKKRAWWTSFRREFFKHQAPIVESAPIMTYEFRELLRSYLESCSPSFKVGLLFSKEKTKQERARREEVAVKEFNRLIDMNLRPHLVKYAEDIIRDLKLPETLLPKGDVLPIAPSSLITEQVKSGASLSGDTVLQFSRDIETALATWVTKVSEPWVHSTDTYMKAEVDLRLEQFTTEEEALYEALDTEALRIRLSNRLNAIGQYEALQLDSNQLDQLAVRNYVDATYLPEKQSNVVESEIASTSILDDDHDLFDFNFSYENTVCEILKSHPLFRSRVSTLRKKIERAKHEQYTFAIFGAFSAGKSSTLNALFGETVLPTSPNPLTASITKIVPPNGRTNRTASITFKSRDELEDELQGYGTSLTSLDVDHPFVNAVKAAPLDYLGQTEIVDYDTFCAFVAQEEKSCIVKEIELYLDSPWARRGIVFVDTPGADSQFNRHSEVQFGYMRDADAVLFVTYYNHAFTEADRELVIQLGRVQGTGDHEMFFLVNASDLATDDEERDAVTSYVSQQLTALGVRRPSVLPISSRNAMQGHDAGFDRFVSTLERYVDKDLRLANAMRIQEETTALLSAFDRVLNEAKDDASVKEHRRQQLNALLENPPALDVSALIDLFDREAKELLAHLETRSLLRLSDFVKETFHPVEVDGSRKSLERALARTLDKYAYDIQQELQVFQYRLERYVKREFISLVERLTERQASLLPTLEFDRELDVAWLREAVEPIHLETSPYQSVLKRYKNASQFFEGDGRTQLKDELTSLLRDMIRSRLETIHTKQIERANTEISKAEVEIEREWSTQLKELADAELSMLTDNHSFDEMHERLESLRKETV
ncbi:dynamin family protein [Exiguobacterium sp. SRB7LM]|uniref:dynamin family protein n=1 Tax=Exiguobacterium sp. SRB7LM TaxID=2608401 RepID=UPI0018C39648|nr:dynamin family protein [Exiguobacterium sp. SRB7LM]MBG0917007.1 dynamin family protein [Exiguobacterium sp. SRB7LM]